MRTGTRTATTTALGTALALVVTLASAISPAFAAEPAVANQSVMDQRPRPPRPQAPAQDEHVIFHPDIKVKYLGPDYDDGTYFFRFEVKNIGMATGDIVVDREVRQTSYDGTSGRLQAIGGHLIDFLDADQAVVVRVPCTPQPGYVCTGATIYARVDYDDDLSNNKAYSH
jgi:hypothetical protein